MKYWQQPWYIAISWLFAVSYMGLIFYWSSLSTLPIPPLFPYFDKFAHFQAYALLGFLLANASNASTRNKRFWFALVFAALYGVSDEVHQFFVPGRECSFFDWLADLSGSWVGAWILLRSETIWRK